MTFRVIVQLRPVSRQTRGGARSFIATLREMAAAQYMDGPLLTGDLYARIVRFYSERSDLDTDNLIKPILDALIGVAYADDRLVVKCSAEAVDVRESFYLVPDGLPSTVYQHISDLLRGVPRHILCVTVDSLLERNVFLGPIDGEA